MVLFLIIMTLWVVGGTATFRRTGHAALNKTRHKSNCATLEDNDGHDLAKCTKCKGYRSVVLQYGHYNNRINDRNAKYPACKFEEGEPRWSDEVCNCDQKALLGAALFWTGVSSYLFWPTIVVPYLAINGGKKFAQYKGDDWSFFVKPKMVQTKSERIAELEANIKQLESATEMDAINP